MYFYTFFKKLFCVLYSFIIAWLFILPCHADQKPINKTIKIGIYDNPPKLFIDKNQAAKGIFPGIISQIAQKEGWKIDFIPISFRQGLKGLEQGTLDIMQDVAWSKQRSLLYGFTNETVMVSWGRLYQKKGQSINTLIDLKGKRIAFMDGGIYSEGPDGLIKLMKKFDISATFVPVKEYRQVFEAIDQGRVDAGVVNRLYGKTNKHQYDIENTPVLISPISIRFAFSKSNPHMETLIQTIDSHLILMKKDNDSIYYQLIDEYIREPRTIIPGFLKNLFYILFLALLLLAVVAIISRSQIKKKGVLLKKRDKALKESENKFQTIFETLQDVYFNTSLSGEIKLVSPSCKELSGYSAKELQNQDASILYNDIADRQILLDQITAHGKVRDYEILLKKKNSQTFWVSVNADLYFDGDEKPAGIAGVIRDSSRKKETELQLVKREERFREMARLLPCGIVETDIDLNITYANEACLDMFGYTLKDLDDGINSKDVIHPKDWDRILNGVEKHFNQEPIQPSEFQMIKKDGTVFIVLWDSRPILAQDTVIGFRGSIVDLTEIKQLQSELIRTQKLESTGILAGGIAHDFNNILLGLFGNLSLAKSELSSTDPAFELILEAEKSMSRAKNLTTQLLTFAQGGDPVKTNIPLDQVVRETAIFHLTGSNIKIDMETHQALWKVSADKGQISQVISNLIINSRQAMPSGGRIKIKLENDSSKTKEQYVKLTLQDQGIGISKRYLDKIFDPYFTTKQDGSGLGLSIVHSIVKKHHGRILVDSTPNQGTCFKIYLPAASNASDSPEETDVPPVNSDLAQKQLNVLVMDDDPLVRDVSKRMLTKLGHETKLCNDGQAAVELYNTAFNEKAPYDLVIVDLTIPGGMGGQEAAQKILDIDPNATMVVSSGYSNDPVLANYQEYGFKAIAIKPYTFELINHVITQAFQSPSPRS